MRRADDSFKVRMASDLKARIEEAARANNRSINAEIVSRLEQSFTEIPVGPFHSDEVAKALEQAFREIIAKQGPVRISLLDYVDAVEQSSKKPDEP